MEGAVASFLTGWDMACGEIPLEDLADKAIRVIQAYVSENRELIYGLREDTDHPPSRWVGAVAKVAGVNCLVLFENALADALERRGIDLEHAKKALHAAGKIIADAEAGRDRLTVKVHKGAFQGRGLAVPFSVLGMDAP